MIYPIKNWPTLRRGYAWGVKTFYNAHHLGLDVIVPVNTPIYAWKNLNVIQAKYGTEGGNTAFIKVDGELPLFRLMHLNVPAKTGHYKEGDIIARSGNTGSMTKGAHLHIDISKNGILNLNNFVNFEDPEIYFKQTNNKPMFKLAIDKNKVQYLADFETNVAIDIVDIEQLTEVKAFRNWGEPVVFDSTGWLIFKGGTPNWIKSKFKL